MICPYCAHANDKVIDSRASEGGIAVRRRRQCQGCRKRFTTYERVEKTARLMVIKRDGSRVPFDGENVLRGIQAACGKRPISEKQKFQVAVDLDDEVHRDFDREVPSDEIGRRVAARLKELDDIAYIRFASEHYEFETLEELAREVDVLKARTKHLPNQTKLFES